MAAERKLHIDNEVWTWKPSLYTIVVRDPNRKSYIVEVHELFGVSPDEIERAKRKGCGYKITPSMIKEHIIREFVEKTT